jgi:hypothetical protein
MANPYPLLDLHDAWKDAHARLLALQEQAEALYEASEETWEDMLTLRAQVRQARAVLRDLPRTLRDGIAQDQADLEEWEAKLG